MASNNSTPTVERVVRGSYDPKVTLSDGRQISLTDFMIELANAQGGGSAGVKDSFVLTNDRSIVNSADTFLYSPSNKPASLLRLPTLTELGYPESGYRLDVMATAYLRSSLNQGVATEAKLVDSNGNDIAGSLVLNSDVTFEFDWPVQINKVSITGGTLLAVDFRRTGNVALDITLYSLSLLVQVVKVGI